VGHEAGSKFLARGQHPVIEGCAGRRVRLPFALGLLKKEGESLKEAACTAATGPN